MTWNVHPAKWEQLSEFERNYLVISDKVEMGEHWKVTRVAELTGLDPETLGHHVEVERGWESHDEGYLHQIVVSAAILKGLDVEKTDLASKTRHVMRNT